MLLFAVIRFILAVTILLQIHDAEGCPKNNFFKVGHFYGGGIKIAVDREVHDGFYDGIAECRRKLTGLNSPVVYLL